jgi:hypothetical protein
LEDKKDVRKKDNRYLYVIVIIFHTCLACLCSSIFLLQIPNTQRQNRQNRGRMNGHMLPQGGVHSFSYMPQSVTSSKELTNQQVFFFFTFISLQSYSYAEDVCLPCFLYDDHALSLPHATLNFYFRFCCLTPVGISILQLLLRN